MNSKVLATLGLSALLAMPAFAGLNPASPGLPPVTDAAFGGKTILNNQASAMCVDCHTVAPKDGTDGSHYVNVALDGSTNSGGSGINSGGTIATSDDGKYFKRLLWDANSAQGTTWPSKYATLISTVVTSVVNQVPAAPRTLPINATTQALTGVEDLICESCHNIVGNEDGGNNLLAVQPANDFINQPVAELCVGCHGFMYNNLAAIVTACVDDDYISDARNLNEVAGGTVRKGNNEYHWIRGTARAQNHHVMTGDNITAAKAAAGALWTDNVIIAYADHVMDNDNTTMGTLPPKATWTGQVTESSTSANLSCTSCHTPAHGFNASPAGSILRGATYTGTTSPPGGGNIAGSRIERISDRGGWKKIDDLTYCTQCHMQ